MSDPTSFRGMRILILVLSMIMTVGVFAQDVPVDSLAAYRQLLETALLDMKISHEERALLNVAGMQHNVSIDRMKALEDEILGSLEKPLDQSGRWPLVAQNMALGAGLYGWAIPEVLNATDDKWVIGSEMVSLGASFYLTYRFTEDMTINHARAQVLRSGALLGLRYGLGLSSIFELSLEEDEDIGLERDKRALLLMMTATPLGMVLADRSYQKELPNHGQAWIQDLWGIVAGVTAMSFYTLIEESPDEPDFGIDDTEDWGEATADWGDAEWAAHDSLWEEYDREYDAFARRRTMLELPVYPLGIYWGLRYTRDDPQTFGDALMLYQGYGAGWLYSILTLELLIGVDNMSEGAFLSTASLGAIGGIYAYDRMIRPYDYTFGQFFLSSLGTASGFAFGFGLSIMADIMDQQIGALPVIAGGVAGTYLTQGILDLQPAGSLSENGRGTQLDILPYYSMRSGQYGLTLSLSL